MKDKFDGIKHPQDTRVHISGKEVPGYEAAGGVADLRTSSQSGYGP